MKKMKTGGHLAKLTRDEKQGIKAIQFLQAFADIDEPFDRALRNWRGMSETEKAQTLRTYQLLKD